MEIRFNSRIITPLVVGYNMKIFMQKQRVDNTNAIHLLIAALYKSAHNYIELSIVIMSDTLVLQVKATE